jgi:hypothetical protein
MAEVRGVDVTELARSVSAATDRAFGGAWPDRTG